MNFKFEYKDQKGLNNRLVLLIHKMEVRIMKRKNNCKKLIQNNKGFTLVEILVSIVILSIIVGAFMSMFVYATKANVTTQELVDTGYIAQTCMEELYTLSMTEDTDGIINAMKANAYIHTSSGNKHGFTKEVERHFVKIEMERKAYAVSDDLTKVTVKVYKDSGHSQLAASVQNIITVHDTD